MRGAGRGELYAALAAVGYGSAYVATAFALRSFEPLPAAVYRSLIAAAGLAVLIGLSRRASPAGAEEPEARPGSPVRRTLHLALIAALGGPVFLGGMNLAVAGVGATIASFVAGLYAVLAAVLAPFLVREPLRPRALAGFVTALAGTGLLAELDLAGPGAGGIAWGLLAAVSFALFLVLIRRWARSDGFGGMTVALATMTATSLGLGAFVLVTAPASFQPGPLVPEAAIAMAWLGFVGAAGQTLAASSLRLVAAARTSALLLLNPVTATILSFVLLGERASGLQVLGGLLVLGGMAAATLPDRLPDQGR